VEHLLEKIRGGAGSLQTWDPPHLQGPWEDQAFGLRAPRAQSMFKMSLLDLGTLENFLVGQHKL
jgi:hypothetical protein